MGKRIKGFIRERGFEMAIYVALIILVSNSLLILKYRSILIKNEELKGDVIDLNSRNSEFNSIVNRADMALRGYMLVPEQSMFDPAVQSLNAYEENLSEIERIMAKYGYDVAKIQKPARIYEGYMNLIKKMGELVKNGNTDEALEILKSDPGFVAWQGYYPLQQELVKFVNDLEEKANSEHHMIIRNTRLSQLVLLLIVIPFLIVVARRMRRNRQNRRKLFQNLLESRRKFLFRQGEDNGQNGKSKNVDEEQIIDDIVFNLQKARNFIGRITENNYSIEWEGLNESNIKLNEHNLSGSLTKMKDQMVKAKHENEFRLWMTEGISKFGDLIRNHQNDIHELSDNLISELVTYVNAKQGGIFILNDSSENNKYLELTGCYAYERKKYLDKKIKVGEGLIGQCFLEEEHIYLQNVPQDYMKITSGLGETNPNSLLLVPLKSDSKVIGVIEIASLNEFKNEEIEFLNQLGETVSSAILVVRNNQNTNELLRKMQQQSEELHAQEEEMRQNMEELEATQEEMARKEKEISKLLEQSVNNEKELKVKIDEIEGIKEKLELENAMFTHLMNLLPDRITIKDKKGTYLRVNKTKQDSLKELGFTHVEGKSDKDFFGEEHFQKSYDLEKNLMESDKDSFIEESKLKMPDGSEMWAITTRAKFMTKNGEILGTIAYTKNITDLKNCQNDKARLEEELKKLIKK